MKKVVILLFLLIFVFNFCFAKLDLPGKTIFYNEKGKFGSCNTCHTNGGSAGRYNPATGEISEDEGKKIPSLKGIGEKKEPDQIKKDIEYMKKIFAFKFSDEQINQLVEYVETL